MTVSSSSDLACGTGGPGRGAASATGVLLADEDADAVAEAVPDVEADADDVVPLWPCPVLLLPAFEAAAVTFLPLYFSIRSLYTPKRSTDVIFLRAVQTYKSLKGKLILKEVSRDLKPKKAKYSTLF